MKRWIRCNWKIDKLWTKLKISWQRRLVVYFEVYKPITKILFKHNASNVRDRNFHVYSICKTSVYIRIYISMWYLLHLACVCMHHGCSTAQSVTALSSDGGGKRWRCSFFVFLLHIIYHSLLFKCLLSSRKHLSSLVNHFTVNVTCPYIHSVSVFSGSFYKPCIRYIVFK